jgi:hypothetical protein
MREFAAKQSQPAHRASVDPTRSRAAVSAPPDRVHPLVHLRRLVGNQAGQRLLRQEPGELGPAGPVPDIVHEVLAAPGQPLDLATRALMGRRFGHDFSRVRVHTDSRAAESARSVLARAYTVGPHVVFGDGEYAPRTHQGSELLAHELAHTVQQAGVASAPLSVASDAVSERSAESAGRDIANGRCISTGLPTAAVGLARAAVPISAYPDDMLAKALAEVQQRLKNPSYSGRDRDVDRYMAFKWEADKRAAASARAEAAAYLESTEPPAQEERYEVPSRFTPGGFTDEDIDPGRKQREQAEKKRREQEALDRQREEEGRPARLALVRRYLILHGVMRGDVRDMLTQYLTANDLRVLVKNGLGPPKGAYAQEVIDVIDKIVPRDPVEDREDLKDLQRRAAPIERTAEAIEGVKTPSPYALAGRVYGYGVGYLTGRDPLWSSEVGAAFGGLMGSRAEVRAWAEQAIPRDPENEPVYVETTHGAHEPGAEQVSAPGPMKPGVREKPGLTFPRIDVTRGGAFWKGKETVEEYRQRGGVITPGPKVPMRLPEDRVTARPTGAPTPSDVDVTSQPGMGTRPTPGKAERVETEAGKFTHTYAEPLRTHLPAPQIPAEFAANPNVIPLSELPSGLIGALQPSGRPGRELRLGVTSRVDRATGSATLHDENNGIIYEIKPDTAGSIEQGLLQGERYANLANAQRLGGRTDWEFRVVVYNAQASRHLIRP